jgi:allantoate deiminase
VPHGHAVHPVPDGVSHNPAEHVEVADVEAGFAVMMGFIEGLGRKHA